MLRKKRFLIGGLIVILAVVLLIVRGFADSSYYFQVSELLEQQSLTYNQGAEQKNQIYDKNVRVKGQVAPGSIEQETEGLILRFTIIDDVDKETSLPVVYQGVVPDTFKAGRDVVVEGRLDPDGIFQAKTLMVKCPSKYEPQE